MNRLLSIALGALAGFLLFGAAGALGAGAVLVNLFTPLPVAILGLRHGALWGGLVAVLTSLAVLAASGLPAFALYLLQFGFPATLLAALLTRGVAWDRTIAATVGALIALGLLVLTAVATGNGQSPLVLATSLVEGEIDQAVSIFGELGGSQSGDGAAVQEAVDGMASFMRQAYPGMLVAAAAAMQLVTVGLLALLIRPSALPGPGFSRWRAPELLIWGVIGGGFGAFLATGMLQAVALNLLVILLPLYFMQGLAVIESFFSRKRLAPLWRVVSYLVMLLVSPLPVIVTTIGVFDLWADFRKPRLTQE